MMRVEDVLPHLMPAKDHGLALSLLEDAGIVFRARNRCGPKLVRMQDLRKKMPELYTRLLMRTEKEA